MLQTICSSVFFIFVLCAQGYADEHFPFLAVVSKESVNLRAGANTNFEKIDKLTQGAEITVLGKSFDWYKVQLPVTAKAYIRADYLKMSQNSFAELVGDKVHIRASANSDSTSLGIVKKGDVVKVIGETNGWCQIQPPPQAAGWIRQDFLQKALGKPKVKPLAAVEVKGQLVLLSQPEAQMQYKLLVNGHTAYYVQNVPDVDRFKGAMVSIKGLIVSDGHRSYMYPVLRTINIALLL